MKKCLVIGLSSIIVSLAYSYSLQLKNFESHPVSYTVSYYGESEFFKSCRKDKGTIAPNDSVTLNYGICIVRSIECHVDSTGPKGKTYDTLTDPKDTVFVIKDGKISKEAQGDHTKQSTKKIRRRRRRR